MERQDHLMLVTDAGVELHLGWDHDIPYTMDPLNGVPVDQAKAWILEVIKKRVQVNNADDFTAATK